MVSVNGFCEPRGRRPHGFTLVEMVVTVSVLTVLTLVAVPSMGRFLQRQQIDGLASEWMASLALARSEATRQGVPVLVRPVSEGEEGNPFQTGWSLYADRNTSGTVDSADVLIRTRAALPGRLRLDGESGLTFSGQGYLSPATARTYMLCPPSGEPDGVQITVAPSGLADAVKVSTCS